LFQSPDEFTSWDLGSTHFIVYDISIPPKKLIESALTLTLELWREKSKKIATIVSEANASSFAYAWEIPRQLPPRDDYTIRLLIDQEEKLSKFSSKFTLASGK
jgi:hypothetical protein